MSKLTGFRAKVAFGYPITTGYRRPLAFAQDATSMYDGVFRLHGVERIAPDQEYEVEVRLARPDYVERWLRPGVTFTVQDGERIAGQGVVVELLHEEDS